MTFVFRRRVIHQQKLRPRDAEGEKVIGAQCGDIRVVNQGTKVACVHAPSIGRPPPESRSELLPPVGLLGSKLDNPVQIIDDQRPDRHVAVFHPTMLTHRDVRRR
jgi:hypothetical protein